MSIRLRLECLSREKHERDYVQFAEEFREEGDDRFDLLLNDANEYFALAERFEKGLDLPEDRVPQSYFLFYSDETLVGASRLRRRLIPVLMLDGGNIGYEVRRSQRRKGFATEILRQSLIEARKIGIQEAVLTAAADNVPSLRTIENANGVFDGETVSPRTGETMRRYRVATARRGGS